MVVPDKNIKIEAFVGLQKRLENLEKFEVAKGKGYLLYFYNYGVDFIEDKEAREKALKEAKEKALNDYEESGGRMEVVEFIMALREYSGNAETQPSFKFVPIVC